MSKRSYQISYFNMSGRYAITEIREHTWGQSHHTFMYGKFGLKMLTFKTKLAAQLAFPFIVARLLVKRI